MDHAVTVTVKELLLDCLFVCVCVWTQDIGAHNTKKKKKVQHLVVNDVNINVKIYADDFFWQGAEGLCFNTLSFSAIALACPHCVHTVAHEEASQVSETGRK